MIENLLIPEWNIKVISLVPTKLTVTILWKQPIRQKLEMELQKNGTIMEFLTVSMLENVFIALREVDNLKVLWIRIMMPMKISINM